MAITFKRVHSSYEGPCVLTWVNRNRVARRLDRGITVFAKRVKTAYGFTHTYGQEFHGIIEDDSGYIKSTEGRYN